MQRKLRNEMRKPKKPTTDANYIGVEIELASKVDRDFLCDKLFEAGVAKYIHIKDDGSIRRDNDYPNTHEICVLAKEVEITEVINKICKVLNEQCGVRVDKSCGLHVHVDMRNRKVEKAFANLVKMQHFLYAMLPANRRNSNYSYPVKGHEWRVLPERYHGINNMAYSKYSTLEARMHSGTTDATKINNWIKFLVAIVEAAPLTSVPMSMESAKTALHLNDDLAKYIESRIAKFAEQHKTNVPSHEEPGSMPDVRQLVTTAAPDSQTSAELSEVA
jgi:hypothetical protein